jgi:hypothetical protein
MFSLPVPTGSPFNNIDPVTFKDPVIVVLVLTTKPSVFDIDAVEDPSAILSNCNPVTPLAGILYKPDPSPIKAPVKKDEVTFPVKFIEPVITVFVTTNSSTDGPCEPDLAMKALPSVVFNANSPNCKLLFVGF